MHVYCFDCKNFKPIEKCNSDCEETCCICIDCNCFNPEDSEHIKDRPNYIEKEE